MFVEFMKKSTLLGHIIRQNPKDRMLVFTRGDAGQIGAGGVAGVEVDSIAGELVEVRSFVTRVAIAGEVAPAEA